MKHIVVVDDEKPLRDLICRYLKSRGYVASAACNSAEAKGLLESSKADLVLLDVELGDEDGLEFLASLKAKYPELPVIILTGKGYEESCWERARANGADGYVSKMLPIDQVLMEIKRLLNYRQAA